MTHLTIITATVTKLTTFVFIVQLQKTSSQRTSTEFYGFVEFFRKQPQLNVYFDKCGQYVVDE